MFRLPNCGITFNQERHEAYQILVASTQEGSTPRSIAIQKFTAPVKQPRHMQPCTNAFQILARHMTLTDALRSLRLIMSFEVLTTEINEIEAQGVCI
ncbi:unnamed protein product [Somion occarium]|uniref:Uncharacterized protein n=1 Tax=Somion occarium TaxID=3059160 RepID=A0ABP1CX32_9APHY